MVLAKKASVIFTIEPAIPPKVKPSQLADTNLLNESKSGQRKNPPTNLLLSDNRNISINIYFPMYIFMMKLL